MLAVTGFNTTIVQAICDLLPEGEEIVRFTVGDDTPECNRYLLCAGLLYPKQLTELSECEISETLMANLIDPMDICEEVFSHNLDARICIIGSESGFTWSHNGVYAAAKAGLHRYVETRKLSPGQQLICIAPSIIEDSGMTMRRTDFENLEQRRQAHPKQRFLRAMEVARLAHFLLYQDEGYLSGQVIRMNGGV